MNESCKQHLIYEFSLLMLSQGRYAQNQCYLGKLLADAFPEILKQRWKFKVEDVVPLGNVQLLTFKPDSIRLRSSRTAMA